MERQFLLRLATDIHRTLRIKLEFDNMLQISLQLRHPKRLIKPIKQEQVISLRVIWHHQQKTHNPMKNLISINISLQVGLSQLRDTSLYEGCCLGDQVIGECYLAEVQVEF